MSSHTTQRAETEATSGRTETDRLPRPSRIRSTIERYAGEGTAAALAGGVLLAGAVLTTRRNARRAGVLGLVGGALLVVGLRRRRSAAESPERDEAEPAHPGAGPTGTADDEGEVSAEAEAHRVRSDVMHQSEANPRGVSGEPDVETRTDPDEGEVRFTEEQAEEPAPKPDLDGSAEEDPRRPDQDDPETPDDHVEVDLSEAAMADEASEATGPDPEQAYPAMEGTDPEPTAPAAPDREAERAEVGDDEEVGPGNGEDGADGGEMPEGSDDPEDAARETSRAIDESLAADNETRDARADEDAADDDETTDDEEHTT